MRGLFLFLLFAIGLGLIGRTLLEIQNQKRYAFKNITILKRQRMTMVLGLIGVIILMMALTTWFLK
ncbi:hypothetical protein [Tuberibacillus calidus]|jgi:cell division septal protein FtsQ|uniref:hypothetical protein n=1 Tax=Tuberibacillus calidus TaxID=340097 RepID=UPI000411AA9C|nr:hypothetical protein [Tuberibacillus calidus]